MVGTRIRTKIERHPISLSIDEVYVLINAIVDATAEHTKEKKWYHEPTYNAQRAALKRLEDALAKYSSLATV